MKMKRKEYMKKETDHHEGAVMVELSVLNRTNLLFEKQVCKIGTVVSIFFVVIQNK